jgi:antitoxin YefM
MISTYHITEKELTEKFLKNIKSLFKNKAITLTISEEIDTTDYLLSSPANKKHLLKSIADLKKGKGIVMTTEELKKFASSK